MIAESIMSEGERQNMMDGSLFILYARKPTTVLPNLTV